MMLRHCIGRYQGNEPKIEPIDTCLATRRDKLLLEMQGQEATLAHICPNKTSRSELLAADQELLKQQLKTLNQTIRDNKVEGHEHLALTRKTIELI